MTLSDDQRKHFARFLSDYRATHTLSFVNLSRKVRINVETLRTAENDWHPRHTRTTRDTAQRLATALDLPLHEVIGDSAPPAEAPDAIEMIRSTLAATLAEIQTIHARVCAIEAQLAAWAAPLPTGTQWMQTTLG